MKHTLFRASFVSLIALVPFTSVVHAQVSSNLTGDADLAIAVNASANLDTTPFVVTQTNAQATLSGDATVGATSSVQTSNSTTVHTHAAMLAEQDSNVSSVTLSSQEVILSYEEPAKLFGFIKVHVPVSASVEANGQTNVSYPWYSFLMSTDQSALTARTQAAIQAQMGNASSSTTLSADAQARILDSLHAVLASEANASASAQ